MKKIFLILILILTPNLAQAKKFEIFSCEPELTTLAREIVGDKAKIVTATNPKQNPYLKIAQDNELSNKMHSAEMVFCSGNGLEEEWLPKLIKEHAFNQKVKSGEAILMAFDGIAQNKKRTEARPHLNPYAILGAAHRFLAIVNRLDVDNSAFYNYQYEKFAKNWQKSIKDFEQKAASLKGKKIVVMNEKWDYLAKWLGLEITTKIIDENGNKKNINDLAKALKEKPADMIIFSDIEDESIAFELGRRTKTRVVLLPITAGNLTHTSTINLLFNNIINRLLTDCSKTSCQDFSSSKSLGSYLSPDQTTVEQNY